MTLLDFIRLLSRHAKLLVLAPLVSAAIVWLLTKGAPDVYESETTIYTGLVSGYTIDSDQGQRSDHLQISTGFDNLINTIKSTETIKEVAVRLIDMQLSSKLGASEADLEDYLETLRGTYTIDGTESDSAGEEQLAMLFAQANDPASAVHNILFGQPSPFNIQSISSALVVKRVGVSDLLSLRYTAIDPVLASQTLRLVSETFMRKYREVKNREASSVLDYFYEQAAQAQSRLQDAVDRLKRFGTENRIINYYEQTKYIASQKELIDQQMQQEQMQLSAAESALAAIEEKLEATGEILGHSNELMAKQQALASLTTSVALNEAVGIDQTEQRKQMDEISVSLQESVGSLYRANHTAQGMAKEQLVVQWLANLLEASQRRASLGVLSNRRENYQSVYDDFAPLGSTLSSLEREVGIAEQEYLELLHSLNQAKLRQQSIELAANLEIMDAPSLPMKPEPSKSSMLVLLAALTSFIMLVGGLVAADILDQTLQSAQRATERTGLDVAVALPPKEDLIKHPDVTNILGTQLLSQVLLGESGPDNSMGRTVLLVTRSDSEYLSEVAALLENQIQNAGQRVSKFKAPVEASDQVIDTIADESEWRIVEFPALAQHVIPASDIRKADTVLLVTDASRVWSNADIRLSETLQRLNADALQLVLTNVKPGRLDEFLGEWPRERSWLRATAKRLARFELNV